MIHLNIRSFVCEYCDKTFTQKTSLRGHLRAVHQGIKIEFEMSDKELAHWKAF